MCFWTHDCVFIRGFKQEIYLFAFSEGYKGAELD